MSERIKLLPRRICFYGAITLLALATNKEPSPAREIKPHSGVVVASYAGETITHHIASSCADEADADSSCKQKIGNGYWRDKSAINIIAYCLKSELGPRPGTKGEISQASEQIKTIGDIKDIKIIESLDLIINADETKEPGCFEEIYTEERYRLDQFGLTID